MSQEQEKISKALSPAKIILPVLIGLGATAYLFYKNYNLNEIWQYLQTADWRWVVTSVLVLLARDGGYIYRIRHLTDQKLTWKGSAYTIVLWEFASAITPSAVGGTAIATLILFKEGISFGKSLAYVLVTAVLDNSYFIVIGAIVLLGYGTTIFPNLSALNIQITSSFQYVFFISYILITLYTALMVYGLFVKPRAIKWLLIWLTSFRWLRKLRRAAYEQGNELMIASKELKGKGKDYWAKAIGSTLFVWTARYFMLNCLIDAFVVLNLGDHLFIFSRQVIMWVIMLISITPGAAGLAEIAFEAFFKQFLGDYSLATGVFWRMFTFYPYLILGAIFLPQWIRRVFGKAKKSE